MEIAFSFIPIYLQMASFFENGETFNQTESMFSLAVCKCSRLCVNFHVGTFRVHIQLLAKFELSAPTPNESRLHHNFIISLVIWWKRSSR